MQYGIKGLKDTTLKGFDCRATHNLYVLLEEKKLIEQHLKQDTYSEWYKSHLSNSTYKPLIDQIVASQSKL